MEKTKTLIANLIYEIIYAVISIIFLFLLNNLNHILLKEYSEIDFFNSLNLLSYDNYKPLKYFIVTFLLGLSGGGLIKRRYKKLRYENLEPEEFLYSLLSIFIILALIILLISFIKNPILKAIGLACILLGGIATSN